MKTSNSARLLAASALMAFASLAHGQYMWIDEKGMKQLSDRPPPPSIPLKHILKAPKGMPSAATEAEAAAAAAATATAAAASPAPDAAKPQAAPTLADRNADFRKRAKEKADTEQKDKEDTSAKADKADNCERARAARQSMDSGARISTQDKNGERGFMSDEQRVVESKKIDRAMAACK
jgi:type IV secretory pathway VirB10-like protein